jgi:uncharacterized surface protein with fasciclin (FAS1) repeats
MFCNKTVLAISLLAAMMSTSAFAIQSGSAMGKSDMALAQAPMSMGNPMVGGSSMSPKQDIVTNASKSRDHTTLVAAVQAAGLVATLQGPGPFTVFAPTNEAFAALPAGTVPTLLKPENKAKLTSILTYHVVPGNYTSQALEQLAARSGGKAILKTVQGEALTLQKMNMGKGSVWMVTDANGGMANITIANVAQSNGTIFVIDKVLMP